MRGYELPFEQEERIVTSVRIRLARNFAAYPFPSNMQAAQGKEILKIVDPVLCSIDDFKKYEMSAITQTKALYLQEQHLISPALLLNKSCGAAYISRNDDGLRRESESGFAKTTTKESLRKRYLDYDDDDWVISLMVNEEDHLREQCIVRSNELDKAYELIMGIDEELGQECHFAYDEKLGYLTACPSNLGTGMRASAMLFLPGMTRDGSIENLMKKMKSSGMTIRGIYGEGSAAEGYEYQISNERTLGVSEEEILGITKTTVNEFCALEVAARKKMLEEEGSEWENICMRAYGILTNSTLLTDSEYTEEIVKIRLGMALGFFEAETKDVRRLHKFIKNTRSASFFADYCKPGMSERTVDELRAEVVREVLPELVKSPLHKEKAIDEKTEEKVGE